jgi:4-amino-4-deoxy-L-arabinose transferase-like glycosyltransferase
VSVLAPTGGPTAYRGPLFPAVLAAVYKVVGVGSASARWEAGLLFEAVLGTITVALIYLIAIRLWRRRVALVAAGLAAVYPPLVLVTSSLLSESLFIPLALGATLSALVHRDSARRWRWLLVTGLLLGLGALTRANGIILLIPIAFLVWTGRPRWSLRSLAAPLAVIATAAVVVAPWMIRDAHVLHTFVPITDEGGYALAGTYNSTSAHLTNYPALWIPPVLTEVRVLRGHLGLNEAQLSDRLDTAAFDYIGQHPGYVAKAFLWNTLRMFNLTGTGFERYVGYWLSNPDWLAIASVYSFWVLGLLALGGCFVAAARAAPWALWGCPLAIFLSALIVIGATRYRTPADPFLILLAALGLVALAERWHERRGPGRPPVPSSAA